MGRKKENQTKKSSSTKSTSNIKKKSRSNNGSSTESSSRKKKSAPVTVALDPPVVSHLSLPPSQDEDSQSFWSFVDPYVSNIATEDINFLGNMISQYSKGNQKDFEIPPLGCPKEPLTKFSDSSDQENIAHMSLRQEAWSSNFELPVNFQDRIIGALVDPDLYPDDSKSDNVLVRNMGGGGDPNESIFDAKRAKLTEDVVSSVFTDKSNLTHVKSSANTWSRKEECDVNSNTCDKPSEEETDEVLQEILKCQQDLKHLLDENEKRFASLSTRVHLELEKQTYRQNLVNCEMEIFKLTQKYCSKKIMKKEANSNSKKSSEPNEDDNLALLIEKRSELLSLLEGEEIHVQ